jgi:hypothetical protein
MMMMVTRIMPTPPYCPGRLAAFGGRSRFVISGYVGILKLAKLFQNYHALVLGG